MISDVRSYCNDRVIQVDSDFRQWADAFNKENIPSNILDKSFFIEYDVAGTVPLDTYVEDTISVTLSLFFKGYSNPQAALDNAIDTAEKMRENIIGIVNIRDSSFLTVEPSSITPLPVDTSNDNSIVIEMVFIFKYISAIC